MFIVATSSKAFDQKATGSVLERRSHRLKRCARSTLAAEAAAMDASVDHAFFMAHFFSMCLVKPFSCSSTVQPIVKVYPTTDCRSLYDSMVRLSSSLQEKRVQLDLVSIREACGGGMDGTSTVRWVPSNHQASGGLTKRGPKLRENLARFCMDPPFSLEELPKDEAQPLT